VIIVTLLQILGVCTICRVFTYANNHFILSVLYANGLMKSWLRNEDYDFRLQQTIPFVYTMARPVLSASLQKGGEIMKELVRLRTGPSRDGKTFRYMLDYVDLDGKRHRISLGHADERKAERQRAHKERQLRMGILTPPSMKLSVFVEDSLRRTGKQIRESTHREFENAMEHFIKIVGDIDYQRVSFRHGELFRQVCLDQGNSPATVAKKLRHLKRLFELGVDRRQLDENPLRRIKLPKSPKKKIEIFTADECERILKAARDYQTEKSLKCDLLVVVASATGMRRGELLNAVW
jgi:hypothetical protein